MMTKSANVLFALGNNQTIWTRKQSYLPLRCAGRRNFLISSLNIPQHPFKQLAIICFSGNYDISSLFTLYVDFIVVFVAKFLSYAWHMTGEYALPIRLCRSFKKNSTKLKKGSERNKILLKKLFKSKKYIFMCFGGNYDTKLWMSQRRTQYF